MNRFIPLLLLLSSIGCATDKFQSNKAYAALKNKVTEVKEEPFDIQFQIDNVDKNLYNLTITLELDDESYVVSPYSQDSIYGHFDISIKDNGNLIVDKTLTEIPLSVPEIDPILNSPVRFVRGKTTYRQSLEVLTNDEFETSGLVWFVLEPSCVPYDVEFIIARQSGKMEIIKTKTAISAGYKG